MDRKELVNKFADKGFLLAPEMVQVLEQEQPEKVLRFIVMLEQQSKRPLILTNSFFISLFREQQIADPHKKIMEGPKLTITKEISGGLGLSVKQEELEVKTATEDRSALVQQEKEEGSEEIFKSEEPQLEDLANRTAGLGHGRDCDLLHW